MSDSRPTDKKPSSPPDSAAGQQLVGPSMSVVASQLKKGQLVREGRNLNQAIEAAKRATLGIALQEGEARRRAEAALLAAEDLALAALKNGAEFARGNRMGERAFIRDSLAFGWVRATRHALERMTRAQARNAIGGPEEETGARFFFAASLEQLRSTHSQAEQIRSQLWQLLLDKKLIEPRRPAPGPLSPGEAGEEAGARPSFLKISLNAPGGARHPRTPLQSALMANDVSACQWLLERGADFNRAGWIDNDSGPVNAVRFAQARGGQIAAQFARSILEAQALSQEVANAMRPEGAKGLPRAGEGARAAHSSSNEEAGGTHSPGGPSDAVGARRSLARRV